MRPDKSALRGEKPIDQPRREASSQHPELLKIPGVEGTATGSNGRLLVYVSRPGLADRIAQALASREFDLATTGEIRMYQT